jgi:hypothetical protein
MNRILAATYKSLRLLRQFDEFRGIARFLYAVIHTWWQALKRRSQRGFPWWKMEKLLKRYPLLAPRIVHQYAT